eukprot:CCRYP_019738-RB/>CCRYP_019738-RB protein AED:0.15 eAED:0.15 QI:365/1/1/1/0.75/0.55/9/2814/1105
MPATTSLVMALTIPLQIAGTSETIVAQKNHTVSYPMSIINRNYDPLSSEETCYAPVANADSNQDGKLSEDEYAQFISSLSNGLVAAESFRDLTFELQVIFLYLDCLCGDDQSGNCCDGYIDISGTSPNDIPTEEELTHLNMVCSKTQGALNDGDTSSSGSIGSEVPTRNPVEPPGAVPTNSPMNALLQTDSPAAIPTTLSPSINPSSRPTPFSSAFPIQSPTYNPMTLSPSSNPFSSPSLRPTPFPSLRPIETPTLSPIKFLTGSPASPSISPSLRTSTTSSSLVPTHPTSNKSPSYSNSSTDSPAQPPPPLFDASTLAPTSLEFFQSSSTTEPTLYPPQSYLPSQAPSSDVNLDGAEKPDEGGTNSDDKTIESSSAAVIVGILFPLLAIGFAGLFLYANEKRKYETTKKDSSRQDENREEEDEEVGLSTTVTERNEQTSCLPYSIRDVAETSRCVGVASTKGDCSGFVVSDMVEENDQCNMHETTTDLVAFVDAVTDVSSENGAVTVDRDDFDNGVDLIEENSSACSLRIASESSGDDLTAVAPRVVHDFSALVGHEEATEEVPIVKNNFEPEEKSRILRRLSGSQSGGSPLNAANILDDPSELMAASENIRIVTRECTPKTCQSNVPDSVCSSVRAMMSTHAVIELGGDVSHTTEPKDDSGNDDNSRGNTSESVVTAGTFGLATPNSPEDQNNYLLDAMPPRDSSEALSTESVGNVSPNHEGHAENGAAIAVESNTSARMTRSPSQEQPLESISRRQESSIYSGALGSTEEKILSRKRHKKDADVMEANSKSTIDQESTTIACIKHTDAVIAHNVSNKGIDTVALPESSATSAAFALTLTTCMSINEDHATSNVAFSEETVPTSYSFVKDVDQKRLLTTNVNDISTVVEAGNWTAVGATAALFADLTDDSSSDVEHMTSAHISDADDYPTNETDRLISAAELKEFEGREDALVSTLETVHDQQTSQQACASVENSAIEAARALQVREMQIISDDDTSTATSSDTSVTGEPLSSKSFLEQAIEKGEWQAVGQAAAILGRASDYSSVSSTSSSDTSTTSLSKTISWDKEDRIKHFDHLIANGDWRGIVVAAGQYQAMEEELVNKP